MPKKKQPMLTKPARTVLIALGIIVVLVLWLIGNYNSLVTSQTQVEKSWAMVETQYQRRFDLIGNLVESVKGGQEQELAVITEIVDARKMYSDSGSSINQKAAAASSIESNVALLPRLQEAYPDLKSNALMQSLMDQLKGTEDGIAGARDAFNTTASNYNKNIRRFPKNIFADIFDFEKVALFKAAAGTEKAVDVKF